ncbi:MAG: dihydroxyacetone kinase subunit DhaK [Acidobacteriota bacterium]|nr:dihydroxyacetone kinase subunit DhaK [Acidobacteriota bacterium]
MKKLINDPNRVVDELIEGLIAAYPGLARLSNYTVVLRADAAEVRDRQVAVISGGGSGHEPAHAGYVGAGMLSAAVAGEVFTSPSPDSVFAAIKTVAGRQGALLIVKNYTGDRLNFGLAAEMARAEGIRVEVVIVADDIALAASQESVEARGIAGTVFVHKIAGAAAAEGKSLEEVAQTARNTAAAVATMGVSLSGGTVPAIGKPGFILDEKEIELGLGIHGEPGAQRAPLQSADAITDRLIDDILKAHRVEAGEEIALLVNNLGATTNMELAIVARRATSNLQSRNVVIQRVFLGTFMSSLEMTGVSLSLLRVDKERLRLLDAPTAAPTWPNVLKEAPSALQARTITLSRLPRSHSHATPVPETGKKMQAAITVACNALIDARERLTDLDQIVGDGDLGITLARGAEAVIADLPGYPLDDPGETLKSLGQTLQQVLGGSSGPLYGVLFLRAGNELKQKSESITAWAEAAESACAAISELGGARVGDRTMLDALTPFASTFRAELTNGASLQDALEAGVLKAEDGAEATAYMKPRRGRSSYLGERTWGHPDGGAVAVALWLRAVVATLSSHAASTRRH